LSLHVNKQPLNNYHLRHCISHTTGGAVSVTGCTSKKFAVWSLAVKNIHLSSKAFKSALGTTQPPIQWTLGVKRPERQADNSSPSSTEAKSKLICNSTTPHAFQLCTEKISLFVQKSGAHPRVGLPGCNPPKPQNRNLKNIDFVDIMISKVSRDFPICRNQPLKSADN
jgi:hypothetical protein